MAVEIKEIFTKKDKIKFFKFYYNLYKGNKYYAPNFLSGELAEFDPKKNDAFRFCKCRMFLAYRGKEIVGRVAGILHMGVNEKFNTKQLRFTRIDFIDDDEVVDALFNTLVEWAKQEGMTRLIGPMSFSDIQEEGMLIEGFDQNACYIEIYNHEYYVKQMQRYGFGKEVDWFGYRIEAPTQMDERLERLSLKIMEKYNYEIIDAAHTPNKQLENYYMQAMDVCEEAFRNLYGTSPLSEKQRKALINDLKQVMLPEFISLIAVPQENGEKKIVAYGFIIPSISQAMRNGNGSMIKAIPQLIRDMKNPEVAEMMSIGVRDEHLKKGVTAIILYHTIKGIIKKKTRWLDTGPELETNHNVQNLWKNYNRVQNKRRRCWGLDIATEEAETEPTTKTK